ncbi:MAG: aminoacyl-histidine dipeptidase [Polyangiaceae bacterium]|nr:aminoacyl-histidine dipeptidase [Polyangiaceae bacterium]
MSSPLENLEPKLIWEHFDQIRQIPRPSEHEEAVRNHVKTWADQRNFPWAVDKVGNICVRVPATKGHESAQTIILQGHLDMVPEKDADFEFDFLKDPIPCRVDGDFVIADKTTLGTDNGIGIAAGMAIADDETSVHGPLELLFTIEEETGLTGATDLDPKLISGKLLLNLDSEEDGVLFVGCAGGCTCEISFDLPRVEIPADYCGVRLEITGLKGGHSGLSIIENRANSIKVLSRVLGCWMHESPVLVGSIYGGNKHNAIPRETTAIVAMPKNFFDKAVAIAAEEKDKIFTEFKTIDDGLTITVSQTTCDIAASSEASRTLDALLTALPDGVSSMSRDIAGLVETSSNLAIIKTEGDTIQITTSSRSSVASGLRGVLNEGMAVCMLAGAKYTEVGAYPAWQPNMASRLLQTCKDAFNKLYGRDPGVTAIHAGLECGIIGEKIGKGADMISFGPELHGVHAPGEKIRVSTVAKFWDFLKQILADLA